MAVRSAGRRSHSMENFEHFPIISWVSTPEIRQLVSLMDSSDLSEVTIELGGPSRKLTLRRAEVSAADVAAGGAAPIAQPPLLSPSDTTTAVSENKASVKSPMVGRFYPAMKHGAKPLVSVGDKVRDGQVVAAIETLRVMNEVESTVSGKVTEILVQPGQGVEFGMDLMIIEKE